jgi:hypothetical protein
LSIYEKSVTRFINFYVNIIKQLERKKLIIKALSVQNSKTIELENALSIKKPLMNQFDKVNLQGDKELIE